MRVLAIAPTGFFADYGCHVRIMGQLMALQELGHTIHLVTYPSGRNIRGMRISRLPLPFIHAMPVGSSWRKILLDALLAPTALVLALRFRPHIIHAYLHEGALMGWFLARLLRVPLTFDYQGSLTAEMIDHRFLSPQSRFLPWLRKVEDWIDHRPQAIFPSSLHAAQALASRNLTETQLCPVADSVDPHSFQPQAADQALLSAWRLPPNQPIIVYLGLLAPYQGTDLLLHAIAHPKLRARTAHFLIMGFPHVAHYQRMAAELDITDRVRFTGAIPYEQAPRYLALGSLAVAPKLSATEASGKLLPYMSMALPIVATDTPVHRQYLSTGVRFADQATPAALATAIAEVLDHLSDYRRAAQTLRLQVLEQYSWQHSAHTIDSVWQDLIATQTSAQVNARRFEIRKS